MADLDDEFERELATTGATSGDDEFEQELAATGVALPAETASAAPARPEPETDAGSDWMNVLLGFGDGASLGHGDDLARFGSSIGNALFDAKNGKLEAERAGRSVEDTGAELVDDALGTGAGQAGRLAGAANTAIAAGGLSAPTIGAQAATGAALGATQAHGEHGMDPWSILLGAGAGGALGGGGAALGKSLAPLAGPAGPGAVTRGVGEAYGELGAGPAASRAGQLSSDLLGKLPRAATSPLLGAGLGAASSAYGGDISPGGLAKGALSGAAISALGPKLLGEGAISALGRTAPGVARAGTALAPAAASLAGPSRASAQDGGRVEAVIGRPEIQRWDVQAGDAQIHPEWDVQIGDAQIREKAYATPATAEWVVQSVLTSGDTGLDDAQERRLTEAVYSGDKQRVIAANFALQQQNPGYARRIQRELEALQEQ